MNNNDKLKSNFGAIITVIIGVTGVIFVFFIVPFLVDDPNDPFIKAARWNKNITDWAYFFGTGLMLPLLVLIKMFFFSGWKLHKLEWCVAIVLSIIGVALLVIGFVSNQLGQ